MKKIKKVFKVCFVASCIIFVLMISFGAIFYHTTTKGLALDTQKLTKTEEANQIMVFNKNGETMTRFKSSFVPITKLSSDTKNAFLCAEDKRFYKHGGLDLVRMAKATLSNLKSGNFSQGASTISQQLIKNTQLSSEKTIKRKLKEIKLTLDLEKNYSKDEILEMYLSNIYFGNGCYGIESASKHYFSKSASNLSLSESAALAATINAPSFYDLEDRPENVKKRRNLILKIMQNSGKITEKECQNAQNEEILLNLQSLSKNDFLFDQAILEASNLLKTTPNNLANSNIKIYTNIDTNLNSSINSIINSSYKNLESRPNIASIVIDNQTKNIISMTGNKNIFSSKKQPGSTIKPILVYAPAIEKNMISPSTNILDEPINISGYSPKNVSGKFHGQVSVRECLKNSYNVPAVKILNELGIENAQNFAKNLGIEFSESDNHLAIALGGFTDGITLKSLCDAYMAFANKGQFSPSSLITKITKDGKTVYEFAQSNAKVMKDSTAYLITNILLDTTKTGTAKRLKDFDFEIASKTGTVGISNCKKNREAFCVAYTTSHTILTYFGGTQMSENINGSTHPTMLCKEILNKLYKNNKPKNFNIPSSIKLENTSSNQNENEAFEKDFFATDNLPSFANQNLKINIYNFENKKPIIEFNLGNNYSYKIIRKEKEAEQTISSSASSIGLISFVDTLAESDKIYEYFVKAKSLSNNNEIESNHVALKTF